MNRAALLALFATCTAHTEARAPYVAFAEDFAAFRTWVVFDPEYGVPGDDHLNGTRHVYFNRLPRPRSREFPVGTVIVKESGDGALARRKVFAMVKRGDAFNADGTKDWELFELENVDERRVKIVWRGVGPTNGDAYGGDVTGGCNNCHGSVARWDYVFSAQLLKLITPG